MEAACIIDEAMIVVGEVVTFRDKISLLEAEGKAENYATMA